MTPSNEPPEIPSLKPGGDKEEKKGTGLTPAAAPKSSPGFKFPGFGTAGKGVSPSLRVRGIPGGSTVMDRLKNLRKKDLIFIAAGLCTLGMAPLAEHLLMSPDDQAGQLREGFDSKGPLFADGSTVYESGSGVGSPGALIGQGTDVITPLNVRDPSNLVMSPGATKKADAVVTPPPPPPSGGKAEPDWRDVLKDSAKSGVSAAVKSGGKLPKPNVKMAGAIRGLSALGGGGGGTGASLKLDALKAEHAPNRAAGSNSLSSVQSTPGYRGATSRSPASSGAGEALRAAGSRQADIFNRGGGAAGALDSAAREAIPTGGAGNFGGRPGQGDETKNPGGSNSKDAKQLGESLAFLRQKMEMEKQMDLKWKKKEWSEFGRRKMLEESAIKMGFDMFGKFAEKAVLDPFANMIGNAVAGGKGTRGFQCAAGDFKFISMAKFGQLECSHVSGTVACKNGLKATGCQDVTLNGSAPDDPAEGGGTIHPPGQVPAAGARNNRQYQSHLGQTSGNLQRGRQELSARMRLMESACANSPGMSASLKKKTCDLSEAAKTIETGYGHLKAASDSLQTAFQKVELAADAMNNETSGEGKLLLGAGQKLNTAAEKLEEAYKALNFSEEKEPNIESAKEAVAKAAEAFEVALKNHEAAQKAIGTVNKALKEAQEAAEAAAASLKEGQDVLTKTIIPGEIADGDNAQGTTTQYPEWRTIVINNKDEALNKTSVDIDVRHQNWVAMNKEAVAARDALHGKANSDQLKPVEGGTPVEGMGAVGTTYNNMLQYTQPLTEKEGGPLISAHKPAWDAYKAAATRDGCDAACAKGIYKQSFDGAIKGVRGTMVSDNSENAAESVRVTANARNLALIIGKNLPAGDAAVARAP